MKPEARIPEITLAGAKRQKEHGRPKWKTLSQIARLLGGEGFDKYACRCVEYYFVRRSGLSRNQRNKFEERRRELSTIMATLSPGERMVVGKFIHEQARMSFDAGLKIGLLAHASRAEATRLGLEEESESVLAAQLRRSEAEVSFYKSLTELQRKHPPFLKTNEPQSQETVKQEPTSLGEAQTESAKDEKTATAQG